MADAEEVEHCGADSLAGPPAPGGAEGEGPDAETAMTRDFAAFAAGAELNVINLSLRMDWHFHRIPYIEHAAAAANRMNSLAAFFLGEGPREALRADLGALRFYSREIYEEHEGEFHWTVGDLLDELTMQLEGDEEEVASPAAFRAEADWDWRFVADRVRRIRGLLEAGADLRTIQLIRLGELADQGVRAGENFRHLYELAWDRRASKACRSGEPVVGWLRGRPVLEADRNRKGDKIDRWPVYQPPDESWRMEIDETWRSLKMPRGGPPGARAFLSQRAFDPALGLFRRLVLAVDDALNAIPEGGPGGLVGRAGASGTTSALSPTATAGERLGLSWDEDGFRLSREGFPSPVDCTRSKLARAIITRLMEKKLRGYLRYGDFQEVWERAGIEVTPERGTVRAQCSRARKFLQPLGVGIEGARDAGYRLIDQAAATGSSTAGRGRARRKSSRASPQDH